MPDGQLKGLVSVMQTRAATQSRYDRCCIPIFNATIIIFQHAILNSHYSRASTDQGQCLLNSTQFSEIFKTKALRQACKRTFISEWCMRIMLQDRSQGVNIALVHTQYFQSLSSNDFTSCLPSSPQTSLDTSWIQSVRSIQLELVLFFLKSLLMCYSNNSHSY